mmetsp:Transcript_12815/g.34955  ORF Transcript_12815/g.34955 Transcript_12815/m.34955 type:complete len:347 (-) Transcript_12815:719-1759(-)|eukprot:CAMPEP_0202354244 /NCGR_PEP_ID=MMETSP1126-20121109/9652_1 /ASSEMBLY_ACC=CAM_ASM_000457 /TAXON_ID=3047 /ORGANISM="Dunaliella tertiolecta, Strain CCMP1320" /LENGTH=346 /DNA_ID=CAMNT_0048946693 /DNA_START=121 /DNA_END=1161 /DNA_ORIENTATION=-
MAERTPLIGAQQPQQRTVQQSQQDRESLGKGTAVSCDDITQKTVWLSITVSLTLYYALCSSTMLVINKVAVHQIPAPSFLLFCQLAVSALVARLGGALGIIEVDRMEWSKFKPFIWVTAGFLGTIFANIKVLQNSNVETFITFRSSTPMIMSLCDWMFLGRTLPSLRSWLCLIFLIGGALGYVMVDTAFKLEAYLWLLAWYVAFIFEGIYVKHMCDSVPMTSWGRVFYTNAMSAVPLLFISLFLNEQQTLMNLHWGVETLFPLLLSCAVGLGMSHAGYLLRDHVSATTFTIVGIMCKIATVMINYMIWDKHANSQGMAFLLICVVAGTFYQQAPKRSEVNKGPMVG